MSDHITLYAYEEDGKLFVYRCPWCGSTGEVGSRCEGHQPPLADHLRPGPERVRVLVPEAGEGLSSDEAQAAKQLLTALDHFTQQSSDHKSGKG